MRSRIEPGRGPKLGGSVSTLPNSNLWLTCFPENLQPPFSAASVLNHESSRAGTSRLAFSRAYSLSLSPHIVHARSNLLPALVASRVYRQLEFLAVGGWYVYNHNHSSQGSSLRKIPSSREDVVDDTTIDLRSKRNVMRFLQLASDPEKHATAVAADAAPDTGESTSFSQFLTVFFKIPPELHPPLFALTLSNVPFQDTLVVDALPMIHRHLTSIGMFGPGFGAVLPKWGGLSEVAQVACRAGAVGGGVYVLGKGIKSIERVPPGTVAHDDNQLGEHLSLRLSGNESIKTTYLVGSQYDLPTPASLGGDKDVGMTLFKSITIVSSPLQELFPLLEGGNPSSAAIVVHPSGGIAPIASRYPGFHGESPPIYMTIHSSDTGECPSGQCTFNSFFFQCSNAILDDDLKFEYLSTLAELCSDDKTIPLTV